MADLDPTRIPDRVWAAVRCEPRFDPLRDYVQAAVDHTVATLAGQVANIAVKKRILKRTATLPEVTGIVDRLRVAPALRMRDGDISTQLTAALLREPALASCTLRRDGDGQGIVTRTVSRSPARIDVAVRDGVVSLDGAVPSLAHKRIAGVLAWWVPGSREVLNGLHALEKAAPTQDIDDGLTDFVRTMLKRDPALDATRIEVRTRDAAVELDGEVPSPTDRDRAEFDTWYVFGVDRVDNRIEIHG